MIVTFKKFKNLDRLVKYMVSFCILLVIYAIYVAYMTFIVNSTLPFARYEELVVVAILFVCLLVTIYFRTRYVKYKNGK